MSKEPLQPSSQSSTTPCRVLIVDDHPIVREGLASLVNAEPDLEVCGQAESAREALARVENEAPDLVLVDLSLEGMSGLELLKSLADRSVQALVVSMQDDPTWPERALAAGALGYVHKSAATREVVQAIRAVRSGRLWVSDSVSEQLLRRRFVAARTSEETAVGSLTDRELEVFVRIGKGLTTRQIGEELFLSPKTVQTYRERIKQKLGLATAAELSAEAARWVYSQTSA